MDTDIYLVDRATLVQCSIRDVTERKRAEEELSRVNRVLRMLSNTNQALIKIADEATLLNEVCRISVEVGGYRLTWVGFAEQDEAKTVRPVAHAGFGSGYIESAKVTWADNERGRGPGGTAIRTGQPYIARNIPLDPAFAPWREAAIERGYKSNIALPLISEGQTFGELAIYSVEADAFDAKEVEILKELADDLAFGITALRTRVKRDQTEVALRESEEQYRLIAENTADTIAVFDLNLNPTYISPSILKLRGYPVQEAMTQTLNQMLTPDSLQHASKMFADQIALESSGTADPTRTAF
jgi:PAS domain-containing protein